MRSTSTAFQKSARPKVLTPDCSDQPFEVRLREAQPLAERLSSALEVPFAALTSVSGVHGTVILRGADAKVLTSADGKFLSRALFPFDSPRKVEFYELRLRSGGVESAEPHAPGTTENLIVAKGTVEITVARNPHRLDECDAILFEADTPHS